MCFWFLVGLHTDAYCDFYAHVKTVDSRPRKYYGAPADVWIRYSSTPTTFLGMLVASDSFNCT